MRQRTFALGALLAFAISVLIAAPASADIIKVNKRGDKADPKPANGKCETSKGKKKGKGKKGKKQKCSLRAAVQTANASSGPDTLILLKRNNKLQIKGTGEDAGATGDLDVSSEIKIKGRDASINAKRIDRIFDVLGGGSLIVDDAVLFNGTPPATESGGAIRSVGTLVVKRSTIGGNFLSGAGASGGGLFNDGGTLTVSNSEIVFNEAVRAGGAIEANGGTTTIDSGSKLNDNDAGPTPGNGGAVHLTGAGKVDITDTTVARNSATAEGGGLWNSAAGTMTVSGAKLAGNTAAGDEMDQGGGGLYNDGGSLALDGTAISSNSATGTSGSGGGVLNNGGTVAITGSAVIGNDSNRAGGGIETNLGTVGLTDVRLIDNSTGPNPGNGGGLHVTGAGTVNLDGGKVAGNTAASEGGGLWNGADVMTIDATMIKDNTASGDDSSNGGGGVYNLSGTVALQGGATVDGNVADGTDGSGGGVLNEGMLTVDDAAIVNNSANRAGGGIEVTNGPVDITDSSLSGNDVDGPGAKPGNGGGLHVTGAIDVNITGSKVSGNDAAAEGGGLWNNTGTMTVDSTVIRSNTASGAASDQGGGGIYQLPAGTLVVRNGSSLVGNSADGNGGTGATSGSGGGILNDGATVTVNSSEFVNNDSVRAGGAIESNQDGATTTVNSALFDANSTGPNPGNGGAIHLGGAGTITVDGSTFTNNDAANEGGGVWNSPAGTFTVTDSSLSNGVANFNNGNTARANGGPNGYQDDSATVTGQLTINGQTIAPGDPGV